MSVIWVPNAVRGSPQLTGDDGPHCSHAAHPSGPPWFSKAEAGLAGQPPVLAQPSQFSSASRGMARRLALHTGPRRISRATRRHRLHHRLQTALSEEAQGGVWQCHIPSPCSKNTPPPSKRLDFHSSQPFNICSFTRAWDCTLWERRQSTGQIFNILFTKKSGAQV